MISRVLETIENKKMFKAGDKVLCAVSGGADSMALLCVLYELREKLDIEVCAANVNHSIRGEEADSDSEYVRKFCEERGIELFYEKVDIPSMAKEAQIGEEECGRRERYRFFDSIINEWGSGVIATGHHMGDNAETVLFNLFRGSGGKGIGGIPYKRDNIVRPLLDVTKEDIKKYLVEKNITWCEDSTNGNCDYTRNGIRNVILVEAEKMFPKAMEKISAASNAIREDDEYLTKTAADSKAFENGVLYKERLSALPDCIKKRVILQALKEWNVENIDTKKTDAVLKIAMGETGKGIDAGNGIRIVNGYGEIRAQQKETKADEEYYFKNGESLEISTLSGVWSIKTVDKPSKMRDNKTMAVFDANLLPEKLCVRLRHDGDYMYPYGMDGKKKIKKIFIDLKIRKELRDKISMLATDDEILFIPGVRKSARYQPSEKTSRYLYIKFFQKTESEDKNGAE